MTSNPIAYASSAALLALTTVLAAANWYLRPMRPIAWSATLVLGCMAVALLVAARLSRHGGRSRDAAESVRRAVVFGTLVLACSLGSKLAVALGATGSEDLGRRVTMAISGLLVAYFGNNIPKTLTPLAALQCDPAMVQALQRRAGWTFVLAGIAYSLCWLLLPLHFAQPLSVSLLLGGTLLVALRLARLRRPRERQS